MLNELREQVSQLGLTIRDFAQFALPGFIAIAPIPLWEQLPMSEVDVTYIIDAFQKTGIFTFIVLILVSYLAGQLIASATHLIDAITYLSIKRRAFGIPFSLKQIGRAHV